MSVEERASKYTHTHTWNTPKIRDDEITGILFDCKIQLRWNQEHNLITSVINKRILSSLNSKKLEVYQVQLTWLVIQSDPTVLIEGTRRLKHKVS